MSSNKLQKIAIFGASGNVGSVVLKHLLEVNKDITITIVSRQDSNANFPSSPQITVKKGSYNDPGFLESSLKGHQLVLITLSFTSYDTQPTIIDAAAKAGVEWIVPNEYGGDGANHALFESIAVLRPKLAARKQIESLGMKWIGVATNPWLELSLNMGLYGVSVPTKTVTFYSSTGSWNSSSMDQVGSGIANLLSLPFMSPANPRGSLQHYTNKFAYISSFVISQQSVFDSVKRVTGTSDADWKVIHSSNEERIRLANETIAAGDLRGWADLMYHYYMGEGLGGIYEDKAKEDREVLGLEEEDLDKVVKGALENIKTYV